MNVATWSIWMAVPVVEPVQTPLQIVLPPASAMMLFSLASMVAGPDGDLMLAPWARSALPPIRTMALALLPLASI